MNNILPIVKRCPCCKKLKKPSKFVKIIDGKQYPLDVCVSCGNHPTAYRDSEYGKKQARKAVKVLDSIAKKLIKKIKWEEK